VAGKASILFGNDQLFRRRFNGLLSDCRRPPRRDSGSGMVRNVVALIVIFTWTVAVSAQGLIPASAMPGLEKPDFLTAGHSSGHTTPSCHPPEEDGRGSDRAGHPLDASCCGVACIFDWIPVSGIVDETYPSSIWAELPQVHPAGNTFRPTTPPPNSVV